METVNEALGTGYACGVIADYSDDLFGYLDDHLTVTGPDGAVWVGIIEALSRATNSDLADSR